jgi:hypothetical protein
MAQKIRLAIVGMWLGAMVFFSFFVAPSAFAVLPSHQAGAVVARTLAGMEMLGLALGILMLLVLLTTLRPRGKGFVFELIVIALMTAAMAVSRFIVSARLHELRARTGEALSQLPPTDATRATFDWLHQVSVGLMLFNLLAALLLLVFLLWRDKSAARAVENPSGFSGEREADQRRMPQRSPQA